MGWKKKIELAVNLLSEIASEFPEDDASEIVGALDSLNDYLKTTDFNSMSEDERSQNGICILADAVGICLPKIMDLQEMVSPSDPPKEMTMQQAVEHLQKEYAEALEKGDDEVLAMNVNEWIENRGIVIVPESSSSEKEAVDS